MWDFLAALVVVTILAALLRVGVNRLRAGRRYRPKPATDDTCAACGSTDLRIDAPGVYVCRACGYEGGSKRGALEEAARERDWQTLPASERIASAAGDLATARHLLVSVPQRAYFLLVTLVLDDEDRMGWNPRRRIHRDQRFRDVQITIENLFAEITACLTSAAEKVPEIEAPVTPTLGTAACRLGEKWDEVAGHVADLTTAVDRAEKILALVPGTDAGRTTAT